MLVCHARYTHGPDACEDAAVRARLAARSQVRRAQLHVENGSATLYSKKGVDITRRFRSMHGTLTGIPVDQAIIDCELVACDDSGMPCFKTLMELGNKAPALCLWCFDLLHLNGVRITPLTVSSVRRSWQTSY